MPSKHIKLAMIQVIAGDKQTPRSKGDDHGDKTGFQGFTDTHLMYLQLACNVAGGILEQVKETESKSRLLDRMRSCVDVSVAINQARSLPDFEQRVKHLLGNFFGVTTVRVLFYELETNELLISSAQMKRKGIARVGLDKGVVGLCATRQTVVHVGNISHHPYIDAGADGLQRTGRPVSTEASMLCGPLVIDSVEGSRLVGVIQLLERRKPKAGAAPDKVSLNAGNNSEEFSSEELSLFTQLLRVCAQAAWRTYKVQELTAQVGNIPCGLVHMLA